MKCENCNIIYNIKYGSGRFCSSKCARSYSAKTNRLETNKKVSAKLKGRFLSLEVRNKISKSLLKGKVNIVICAGCNKKLNCRPSDKRKFCSFNCWHLNIKKNKTPFNVYKEKCKFIFNLKDYPNKFDLNLIKKYGLYSPSNKGNNLDGISKDHMLSIKNGFEQNIDPIIISHPANCELLPHKKNQNKKTKSSITLTNLLEKIKYW
jgi:hypothetical protein